MGAEGNNPIPGSIRMETKLIDEMDRAEYNPRVDLLPSDPEYQQLAESIRAFAYVSPIVWNARTNRVVAGHQRMTVLAREFGCSEVDVSVVDVDETVEKAMNLALNKLDGRWDQAKLVPLIEELSQSRLEMAAMGYPSDEVEALLSLRTLEAEVGQPANKEPDLSVEVPTVVILCEHLGHQAQILREMKARGLTATRGSG